MSFNQHNLSQINLLCFDFLTLHLLCYTHNVDASTQDMTMKFQAPAIVNSLKRASCLRCISSRIILEKLTVSQLVKKISSAFYGTRHFVTVLTTASHLTLSRAKLNQSTPSRLFSLRVILVLPSHLRLVFQVTSFLSGFPTKKNYMFLPSPS